MLLLLDLGVTQGCFCMILLLYKVCQPSLCAEDAGVPLWQANIGSWSHQGTQQAACLHRKLACIPW